MQALSVLSLLDLFEITVGDKSLRLFFKNEVLKPIHKKGTRNVFLIFSVLV